MIEILPFGQSAALVNFEQKIEVAINQKVVAFHQLLEKEGQEFIRFTIPAYCSLTIGFDSAKIDFKQLKNFVSSIYQQKVANLNCTSSPNQQKIKQIPVCYEAAFAPDLIKLAQEKGLSKDEIIRLHSSQTYHVFMLGFLPGFPYLGTLPSPLQCKRLERPRPKVAAGSIGLAGLQTGIYPKESPGGWQIIGQTPLTIFNPKRQEPFLLKAGDRVQFYRVNQQEFFQLKAQEEADQNLLKLADFPSPEQEVFEFKKKGMMTSWQDAGQVGQQQYGVPTSGFMDKKSARLANRLVGNRQDEKVLEIGLDGPLILLKKAARIAFTGADLSAKINGQSVQQNQAISVKKGDQISFGKNQNGRFTYLAVAVAEKKVQEGYWMLPKRTVHPDFIRLRVSPGPEFHLFSKDLKQQFFGKKIKISNHCSRMGFQLNFQFNAYPKLPELTSSGVLPGTIQVTHSGQPIVLMRDAQTTGGYPRLGIVWEEDLDKLAQLKAGGEIWFSLKS